MPRITRHAFLTPAHNCWSLWTSEGCESLLNEASSSHRVLETLTYAIDRVSMDGWQVKNLYADQGTPNLVLLVREEEE